MAALIDFDGKIFRVTVEELDKDFVALVDKYIAELEEYKIERKERLKKVVEDMRNKPKV
jgi:hypothetical protein